MLIKNTILLEDLFPSLVNNRIKKIVIAFVTSLALWASAKIQVPFYPVPFTFQTMIVLITGIMLGWRLGLLTISLYYLQGILGLPVFANSPERGLGMAYILGPTGGYLIGFSIAILITGLGAKKGFHKSYWKMALLFVLANLAIYATGLLWLSKFLGWEKAISFGFFPFVLGDLFKILLATLAVSGILIITKKYKP